MTHHVESVDPKNMANQLRELANEVEGGGFVAFVFAGCDEDGGAGVCCMVDQNRCTDDLLDEMVYTAKTALFGALEDGR